MIKHRSGTRWLNDWEVEWRRVWSVPCTRRQGEWVSCFSLKTKVDGFSRFGFKTDGYGSYDLALKPLASVSRFGPQNRQLRFGYLAHKITTMVS
jgi:hypothetical protein